MTTRQILDEDAALRQLATGAFTIAAFGGEHIYGLLHSKAGGCWGRIPDSVIASMTAKGWLTASRDVNDWPRLTHEGAREAACRRYNLVRA